MPEAANSDSVDHRLVPFTDPSLQNDKAESGVVADQPELVDEVQLQDASAQGHVVSAVGNGDAAGAQHNTVPPSPALSDLKAQVKVCPCPRDCNGHCELSYACDCCYCWGCNVQHTHK